MMKRMRGLLRGASLKYRLFLYFVVFSAAILGLIWLMQVVLLGVFYENMKIHEIRKIGDTIISAYHTPKFQETIYKTSYNDGVVIRMSDSYGNVQLATGAIGDGSMEPPYTGTDTITDIIARVRKSASGKAWYITSDDRVKGKILIYGAKLPDVETGRRYLLVNSQIAPVDTTASVLRSQLTIMMAVSLFLSLCLSLLIAYKISKPLVRIGASASRLAKGDYGVRFEKGGYGEINALAETLNYATGELSKTEKLRRQLIANVSHDLRTPLTMVKMYAELIRDVSGSQPEKRREHTQVIIDEVDRLSALLTDLLDLSRMQSGTLELHLSAFDLAEKTRVILSRFDVLTQKKGCSFSLECAGDLRVRADEPKIEQVIYNLLGNAVNYTGKDKKIAVRLREGDGGVRFEVKDTGAGIPPDELPSIWERYYRAGREQGREAAGTGLGLAIVKGILEQHRARYGAESAPGQGSTFWFELPRPGTELSTPPFPRS